MTQSQAEILDNFDKTIDAVGIANHLAEAKLIKPEGKPLIRMIIFCVNAYFMNGKFSCSSFQQLFFSCIFQKLVVILVLQ